MERTDERERHVLSTSRTCKYLLGLAVLLTVVAIAIPLYVSNISRFVGRQDVYVLGPDKLIPGSRAAYRVVVANRGANHPVKGASVTLAFKAPHSHSVRLLSGKTDSAGTLSGSFRVPDVVSKDCRLVATASSSEGTDTLNVPIAVERAARVLLTTDKPVYQPGQTIHLRTLALLRPSLKPADDAKIRLTIEDPKQNKVFDKTIVASEWGIASADFQLGDEINLGRYAITARIGDTETARTVTVKRYVLPKFKVSLNTERTYYLPGQTLRGTIRSAYFFGKPVNGAKTHIDLSALGVKYETFAEITGRTDAGGAFAFEARIPNFLAGQPVSQGSALVKLAAAVTDSAGHTEEVVQSVPVAKQPLRIAVVPESGQLEPGVENMVYVVTSYPDGQPARTRVAVTVDGVRKTAETDRLGIATLRLTPKQGIVTLKISASTASGLTCAQTFTFDTTRLDEELEYRYYRMARDRGAPYPEAIDSVLIRADEAVYMTGETADLVVLSTKQTGPIYVDAVLDGQTILTKTAYLDHGRANLAVDLSDNYSGTVTFCAYVLASTGVPMRDTATVIVRNSDQLKVGVQADKPVYLPGDKALLRFHVTDDAGAGVPAAIGLNIVDESVFSVEEQAPGLAALYFALQDEILKPRYQVKFASEDYLYDRIRRDPDGLARQVAQQMLSPRLQAMGAMPDWATTQAVLSSDRSRSLQRAAKVLFASAMNVPDPSVSAVTQYQKDEMIRRVQGSFFGWDDAPSARWFVVIVGLALVMGVLVSAYQRRRPWLMLPGILVLIDAAVLMVAVLVGSMSGGWAGQFNMSVQALSGLALFPLFVAAMAAGARMHSGWGEVGCGICILIVLAAILFPVFARAREAARRSTYADLLRVAQTLNESASKPGATGGAGQVRVRQFFPETLYSNPSLITDRSGSASVELTMADSITTWRLSGMASSMDGRIGSVNGSLRAFQDFFVDIDLPVGVTQGDVISMPVAVYNYLSKPQTVTVALRRGDWFTLSGESTKTIDLRANEVTAVYFPITADELGLHGLTVEAHSPGGSDAIRREMTVYPDGQRQFAVVNGTLSGRDTARIDVPRAAVPGASKLLIKLYPGVFSQVVDGLDGLLKAPYGCFEQTSSITYPNVLIAKYLRATKKDKPEPMMKAEQFISLGYQRLLTFEVPGGGFDWFGNPPANTVLSAYGVMELTDMADVAQVDKRLIKRAFRLLETRQNADGSWSPDSRT